MAPKKNFLRLVHDALVDARAVEVQFQIGRYRRLRDEIEPENKK